MNANIQTITLDLTNSAFSAAQKVSVVQGDSGTRPVKAIITDNGVVRTDLSHNSARIYISNVPGEPPTYVEGILIINGVAEFCIPQSATLQPGIKNGELRLVGVNEKVLSSMPFMIEVNPSQYDEKALLGTDKGDVLERMIEETSENKSAAEESAEAARKSAEVADDAAKAAAESAAAAQNAATPGVSYSEEQNLTPEQKETARNNINAVDASLVVSSISDDSQIPNGAGVRDAIEEFTLHECVRCDVEQPLTDAFKQIARENIDAVDASLVVDNLVADKQFLVDHIPNGQAVQSFIEANSVSSAVAQTLSDSKKQIARTNIGAISQAELDEAIANIGNAPNKEWKIIATGKVEEDGVTRINITKDNDGPPFEIYDALVVYTDAPIATETINIYLLVNNQYSNLAFQALHKSEAKFARITANWDGGNWAGISLVAGSSYSYVTNVGGMTQYNAKKSPATSISLTTESTTPFPIGTKFELRGVVKV